MLGRDEASELHKPKSGVPKGVSRIQFFPSKIVDFPVVGQNFVIMFEEVSHRQMS